jgi:hypothetical protein
MVKESGLARVRRLMRDQKCYVCEEENPVISIPCANGKVKHYHIECKGGK